MNWTKLGLIFQPSQHALPNGCFEFAQSPQTLLLDDRVRIYFSTRQRESNGKFLSHVAFVDYDQQMKEILNIATEPVIPLGNRGCFDEHGIFPMNVVRQHDCVYAYTCGWSRRISVPIETSIGLAVSKDNGLTFQKLGDGPILTSSLNEPFLVGDPFVAIYGTTWHMWYIFGACWLATTPGEPGPTRIYKIGHATSLDGIEWVRDGRAIISDVLNPCECQALPTVIEINDQWHMWFCYREATDFRNNKLRGYRLGYAHSDDLINWKRDDSQVGIDCSHQGWDSDMLCYPHVYKYDDKVYLLYNGNEFGRYGFGLAVLQQ